MKFSEQIKHYFNLSFGLTHRVNPKQYLSIGLFLILFKYLIEFIVDWFAYDHILLPWEFLNPIFSDRVPAKMAISITGSKPSTDDLWTQGILGALIWTLPFIWVMVGMSVRRAADAGISPWWGFFTFIPWINWAVIFCLCFLPTSPKTFWLSETPKTYPSKNWKSAILGLSVTFVLGIASILLSVYGLEKYGLGLFVGTPFVLGVVVGYIFNMKEPKETGTTMILVIFMFFLLGWGMMAFALEGLICLLMALPLAGIVAFPAAILGRTLALRWKPVAGMHPLLVLLVLTGFFITEPIDSHRVIYPIKSSVEINAPPSAVWKYIGSFPDIRKQPEDFVFKLGIAYPTGTRLEGKGVGATRYCDFSTGPIKEKITVWEENSILAFDVLSQPEPMIETSPWGEIHPPHLTDYVKSHKGEFRLVKLSNGRTRLEGTSWYSIDIHPHFYWKFLVDRIIHKIYLRVFHHIKQLAEK